jgi:hypothetical protein
LNWAEWEEEQPDWFDDARKSLVPAELIPKMEMLEGERE